MIANAPIKLVVVFNGVKQVIINESQSSGRRMTTSIFFINLTVYTAYY